MVSKVIAFPSKRFREWGPIAQALGRYLHELGATAQEARDIIDRLQVEWRRHGLPLTRPDAPQAPAVPPPGPALANSTGMKYHVRQMPRNLATDDARSLFELAKRDYERLASR